MNFVLLMNNFISNTVQHTESKCDLILETDQIVKFDILPVLNMKPL